MGKLKVGDSIVTSGLNTEAYNGLRGAVKSGLNESGRHAVQLRLADGSTKDLAIKPENLSRSNEDMSAQAKLQKSEQKLAEEQPPPPFYDENLAPEYQDSMVFTAPWKEVLDNVYKGDDCDVGCLFDDQPIDDLQLKHLHLGVIHADLPWLVAILRRGAVIDAPSKKGTPLQLICSCIRVMGEFTARNDSALPRSRVAILEFLLSVGADPNAVLLHDDPQAGGSRQRRRAARGGRGRETTIDMSIIPSGMQASALHEAALLTSDELATRIFDLLLKHKADPTLRNRSGKTALDLVQSRGREALHASVQEVIARYQNTARPARLCPCNSGSLLSACHGAKNGVPIHPRMICPCEARRTKGKKYGKCCKKRGLPMRETLDSFCHAAAIDDAPAVQLMGKYMQGMKKAAAAAGVDVESEEYQHSPMFPKMRAEGGLDEHNAQVRALNMQIIQPLVEAGKVDAAYLFAANKCEFYQAKPWRKGNAALISKGEMEIRQTEWNAFVDEYIEGAAARGDHRSAREIEKAAKVSWTGGPLYAFCGHPACGAQESDVSDPDSDSKLKFQLCSRCKQSKFCSDKCFKEAWKPHHKAVCGTDAAEPRLPSEVAFSHAYTEYLGGLGAMMGGESIFPC